MTECKHEKTSVTNSCNKTTGRIKKTDYDCFTIRTRKCDSCGVNIQTVEIDRDEFEKLLPKNVKQDIIQDLIKYLNNQ